MRDVNVGDEQQALVLSLPMKIGQLISILRGTACGRLALCMHTRNE